MLSGSCLLHAACRQVHFPRFMLDVVRYIFSDACCMLSMVLAMVCEAIVKLKVRLGAACAATTAATATTGTSATTGTTSRLLPVPLLLGTY